MSLTPEEDRRLDALMGFFRRARSAMARADLLELGDPDPGPLLTALGAVARGELRDHNSEAGSDLRMPEGREGMWIEGGRLFLRVEDRDLGLEPSVRLEWLRPEMVPVMEVMCS